MVFRVVETAFFRILSLYFCWSRLVSPLTLTSETRMWTSALEITMLWWKWFHCSLKMSDTGWAVWVKDIMGRAWGGKWGDVLMIVFSSVYSRVLISETTYEPSTSFSLDKVDFLWCLLYSGRFLVILIHWQIYNLMWVLLLVMQIQTCLPSQGNTCLYSQILHGRTTKPD